MSNAVRNHSCSSSILPESVSMFVGKIYKIIFENRENFTPSSKINPGVKEGVGVRRREVGASNTDGSPPIPLFSVATSVAAKSTKLHFEFIKVQFDLRECWLLKRKKSNFSRLELYHLGEEVFDAC